MFTGLVEALGEVLNVEKQGPGVLLTIRSTVVADELSIGDSISVNGCCLTVVAIEGDQFGFEAGEETLSRTNLGQLRAAHSRVNLERSVRVGDRLGGHYVSGHIDCVGSLDERIDDGEWAELWFRLPAEWTRHLVPKGSITVDGVSLTVVHVETDRFSVALIPHTLDVTTLGRLQLGDPVNIETDMLAKYVEKLLAYRNIDK